MVADNPAPARYLPLVQSLIAQAAFFVATLYFVGYFAVVGFYSYFGLPARLLGDATNSIVLQGGRLLLLLALLTFLIASAAVPAFQFLRRLHAANPRTANLAILMAASALVVTTGIAARAGPLPQHLIRAAASCGLLLCGMALLWLNERSPAVPLLELIGRRGLILLTGVLGLAVVSVLGQACGFYSASVAAADRKAIPAITLHSKADLGLSGTGVTHTVSTTADVEFKHEYRGYLALTRKGGKWYLVPAAEPPAGVRIVPDSDDIWVELAPR
jgi:hypothetical protein